MKEEDAELVITAVVGWLGSAEMLTDLASMPDMLFELSLRYVHPKAHSLLKRVRDVSKDLPTKEEHVLTREILAEEHYGTAN